MGASAATLTIAVDESAPSEIAVHVLLDADSNDIADHEILATRNADGVKVDAVLRVFDRTLSTGDCQDLAGTDRTAPSTVTPTIANGLESFTFSFDPNLVPGNLVAFRWAAFGQAPPAASQAGPWDLLPDSANPESGAANPGDRRCDSGNSGLRVRMSAGVAFPDPPTTPDPIPPGPEPPSPSPDTARPSLSALSLSRTRFRAGGGTLVSYRLSEAARVTFRIGSRGSFVRQGRAGSNSFRLMGRLRGRRLAPGRYRLRAVATDSAGNSSQARYTRFRIVRR
ncbi:MAG TPA: hypothetical protein VK486_09230 [Thermoleophilaceae bacterium]|nr:hypothetical protein [Thermoleophilaceae bacterium]